MKAFAQLYAELDETTSTTSKVAALVRYFRQAPAADAAWAVALLSGRRPKRLMSNPLLTRWAAEAASVPEWLFEESRQTVGDTAETIALLLPDGDGGDPAGLAEWMEQRLLPLRAQDEAVQHRVIATAWRTLRSRERLLLGKLLSGAFRVGVSAKLVTRGLATVAGVDEDTIAHRLMGAWEPTPEFFTQLIAGDTSDADQSRPYPFCLAYPVDGEVSQLGNLDDWNAEWKWDGIRAQVVRRRGRTWLWSRGEELLEGRFPEVEETAALLPDGTVLDGELLGWRDGGPLPFAALQRRIGRKTLTRKVLADVPAFLLAFDLLEWEGIDWRERPLSERRARLESLVRALPTGAAIGLSPQVDAHSWSELAQRKERARAAGAEGIMLKRLTSIYAVGRKRGDWWKWKVDPFLIDAVLIAAEPGHGRRAGLFTDYTFGVWDGEILVPIAKAYSGLTDDEIHQVDAFVRKNTLERFGPVRTVRQELVFELAFEGIQTSTRHKSGIAVRFPRMNRWRHDKPATEADTLEAVRALLREAGSGER